MSQNIESLHGNDEEDLANELLLTPEQKREEQKKLEAFLYPNAENSSLLYQHIYEQVYNGEKSVSKREKEIENHGFDIDVLVEKGKEVRKRLKLLEDDDIKNGGNGEDFSTLAGPAQQEASFLRGLAISKINEGKNGYDHHSDLSIGLADLLVERMRRIDYVAALPLMSEHQKHKTLNSVDRIPFSRGMIGQTLDEDRPVVVGRAEEVLQSFRGKEKDRYQTAWNILESAIITEQENSHQNLAIETEDQKVARELAQREASKKLQTMQEVERHATSTELVAARQELNEIFDRDERDFYGILGVSRTSSPEEIRTAYRKLVLLYHPDRNLDKSPEEKEVADKRFKEATEAFDCLSDADKRKEYDASKIAVEGLSKSIGRETGTNLVPVPNRNELAVRIQDEIRSAVGEQLPAVIERFENMGALTKFVYEVETQGGVLQELSSDLKNDSKKIQEFFEGYNIPMSEQKIQSIGAGIYEGMVKQKKKKEGGLLNLFFQFLKAFDEDVSRDFRRFR